MSTKYRSFVHQINLLIRFVWILYTAILKIRTEPAVRESAKCDPIILRLSVYPGIMAYGWKDILTFEWRWLGCTWWRLVMPKSCWISVFLSFVNTDNVLTDSGHCHWITPPIDEWTASREMYVLHKDFVGSLPLLEEFYVVTRVEWRKSILWSLGPNANLVMDQHSG